MTDTPVSAPTDPFADPHAVRRYVPLYPDAVEAVQWDGSNQQALRIVEWLDSHGVGSDYTHHDGSTDSGRISFHDPETGWLRQVTPGRWVVRSGNHFQVVSGGWFEQLYKQVHPKSYSAAEREQIQDGVFAPTEEDQ